MSDLTSIGTGVGGGGVLGAVFGWLVSHVKHKEIKEEINARVHKETCLESRTAIHDKFGGIDKKLNRIDEKLDRLIERRVAPRGDRKDCEL